MRNTVCALMMLALVCLAPTPARAQDDAVRQQMTVCINNWSARTVAEQSQQWERLISLAREYISGCLGFSPDTRSRDEAGSLSDIALGIIQLRKSEDVIPITNRCVTIQPDRVECWVFMGQASGMLGKLTDARRAYERAIGIGGYDVRSAAAIEVARQQLAGLDQIEKAQHQGPNTETPPASKKFGTGFWVSDQGLLLTNDHVVAGCKALVTRDGKPLQVLSRSKSSDLALLEANVAPTAFAIFRTGSAPKTR